MKIIQFNSDESYRPVQGLYDLWYKSGCGINLIVIDLVLQYIDNLQCETCLPEFDCFLSGHKGYSLILPTFLLI